MVIKVFTTDYVQPGDIDIKSPESFISVVSSVPAILLAYGFQPAFFSIYGSLKEKSERNGIKITICALLFTFTVYQVVSFAAIYVYGFEIKTDVLNNVGDEGGVLSFFLQALFLLITAMNIPVGFFVGKQALLNIINEVRRRMHVAKGPKDAEKYCTLDSTPEVPRSQFANESGQGGL